MSRSGMFVGATRPAWCPSFCPFCWTEIVPGQTVYSEGPMAASTVYHSRCAEAVLGHAAEGMVV